LTCFFEKKYHSYVYDSVLAVTVWKNWLYTINRHVSIVSIVIPEDYDLKRTKTLRT